MAFNFAADFSVDTFEDRESCRSMIADLRNLEGLVKHLSQKASQGQVDSDDLAGSLSIIDASIDRLDVYARYWTGAWVFPTYCPSRAVDVAQKVFDIPELLEMVLSYLDMDDLLAAQYINRQFRNAVDCSNLLRRKLSLLPHASQDFYAPFSYNEAPGVHFFPDLPQDTVFLQMQSPTLPKPNGDERHVKAMQANFDAGLPKVGSRCRRMLVFQPPFMEVRSMTTCCQDEYPRNEQRERVGIGIVRNPNGITVGDLLDAAEKMSGQHWECPFAAPGMHDLEDGHVKMKTLFQTWVLLRDEDPLVKTKVSGASERGVGVVTQDPREKMMLASTQEKARAYLSNEDLPLFEDFAENFEPE